jgi:hypothetical protein
MHLRKVPVRTVIAVAALVAIPLAVAAALTDTADGIYGP